jgi:hypothetical protein
LIELSKIDFRNCATTLVGVFEFGIVGILRMRRSGFNMMVLNTRSRRS